MDQFVVHCPGVDPPGGGRGPTQRPAHGLQIAGAQHSESSEHCNEW